ncbi:Leucine-zipper-like transcriptional regulator 1 [Clydaea vesicula]|uniref:Leucine-zipper-like transcriptional regulator 1 n=1 Tax=Clydaea vesicula TaxID=447962 RepID=A0AAD5XY80_9FUNG|nr:Leucine-zipper-like transcriptional regulator 1 [Clydaea vesicula]
MNVTLVLTFVCYIIQLVASKENVLLLVPGSIAVLKGCNNFTCTVKPVEDTSPPQIEALITGFTHIVFADINNSFAASAEVVPSKYINYICDMLKLFRYMDKTFVIFDFIPKVISSNLQIFMFKLEEVGFLAGVTAGLISTKKVVAVISGLPSVENKKHVNGFLQGVVYSCPLCKVQYQYSKSNTNYTLAIENAKVLNDAISYDVIHVAMQSGSFEVLNWAAKEKIYVIGANYDNLKSPSAFGQYLLLIDPIMEFYLNSIIKQYDVAISESLKNKEKNIISGFFELGSANGGVAVTENTSRTYSLFSNQTRQIEVVSNKVECTSSLLFTKKKFLFNTYTRLQNNSIEVGVNGSTGYLSGLARGFNFELCFVYSIVLANDTFTVLHPFGDKAPPIWRNSFTLGTNNLMYVFGGLISGIESNTLYALDMNEYKWVKMETLSDVIPDARESHAAVYFENNLVIMGGMRGHQTFCDMWKFSTESKSWSEIKLDMKFCRGRFAYTLIDHLLYIFGGFDEAYAIRNDLATIDVLSGTVTLMKPLTDLKPPVLLDSMMIAFDSNVFVYGGSNLTDVTNQFYKFNIENNLWTLLNPRGDPPPVLAKGLMTKIDENRLMISGGISANSILQNSNFFFDIKNNIWKYGEISNLPSSLVSFSGFLYRQPENPCMWKENPNYSLCNVDSQTSLILFGGYESEGVSDKLIKYQIGPQRPPLSSCRPGYYLAIDIYDEPVCTKCPEGSYNTNGNGICESCPHGGVCPGGSEVNVAVGFWQDANSSTSFPYIYKCPIDTCCSIAQGCNTTQQCKYGTTGALCSECSEAGHSLWVNEWYDHCSYWILVEVIERVALASIAATYSYPEIDYAWGYFISIVVIIILQQNNVYRKNIENWSKLFLMLTMLGVAGIKLINGETDVTTDPTMQSLNQTSYNTHWKNFWLSAPLILAAFRIISDKLIRFFPKKKAVHLDIEKVK